MSQIYLSNELDDISEEGDKARQKFGEQLELTDAEWLAILVEEVGEAANVLNERSLDSRLLSRRKDILDIGFSLAERREQLRGEVLQVAAVAARWLRVIDSRPTSMTLEAIEKRAALEPADAALGRDHTEGDHSWHCVPDAYALQMRQDARHADYAELRALRSSNEELRKALGEAVDVATWMSGSSSFSPEGEAAEGWEKARPKLDAARSLLVGQPAQALRRAADEVGS